MTTDERRFWRLVKRHGGKLDYSLFDRDWIAAITWLRTISSKTRAGAIRAALREYDRRTK
jgi:hypothetical protein